MAIVQILISINQTNKGTNRRFAFKILCHIKFIFLYQSMCMLSDIQKIGDSPPSKNKKEKKNNDTLTHKILEITILVTYTTLVT